MAAGKLEPRWITYTARLVRRWYFCKLLELEADEDAVVLFIR